MKFLVIVGLVLGAAAGCDASGDNPGFGNGTGGDPVNQRGDVDAGGAGGGAAGTSGSGGAPTPGTGGASATGGRAGAGGAPSTGGNSGSVGGSGGSAATALSCDVYGWSGFGYSVCSKQVSTGVFQHGSIDGHPCAICGPPARPAGVPECKVPGSATICVLSCDECTFQ